jgi:hypothetical protein
VRLANAEGNLIEEVGVGRGNERRPPSGYGGYRRLDDGYRAVNDTGELPFYFPRRLRQTDLRRSVAAARNDK